MLPFYIVDVFAEKPYQGNQLAVFIGAKDLNSDQMLAIAKEINFAESTFIMGLDSEKNTYTVRIFTPERELPFAGHPIIGTSYIIASILEKNKIPKLSLDLQVGTIPVDLLWEDERIEKIYFESKPPVFGNVHEKSNIGSLLEIEESEINDEFPVLDVSTGTPFTIIPLRDLKAVQKAQLKKETFVSYMTKLYGEGSFNAFFIFCKETVFPNNQIHGRMLYLQNGVITEDSATGSANSCLLGYLLKTNYFKSFDLKLRVEQGYEINRPSLIELEGKLVEDQYKLQVGGKSFLIAKGEWVNY